MKEPINIFWFKRDLRLLDNEPLFNPKNEIFDYSKKEWKELTNDVFNSVFKNSPVNRTKFEGLKRNIDFTQ